MTLPGKTLIKKNDKSPGQKDGFCMACAAVPVALAGSSSAAQERATRKSRRRMFRFGIVIFALAIGVGAYYKWIKKCKECTA